MMDNSEIEGWLAANDDIESVRAVAFDLNSVMRGKRLPIAQLDKVCKGEMRMPLSSANVDIWGCDIDGSKLVFETGDADGKCVWTGRGPLRITWTDRPTAMVPLVFHNEDDTPFEGDCRNALASLLARYAARGMKPVVAFELEFYLTDPKAGDGVDTGANPLTGAASVRDAVLSVDELNDYDALLNEIYDACAAQQVDADATISESGRGQFEVNLKHGDDALKMADDAMLFKHIVKGVARKHGLAASFMAKPYGDRPGNGLHMHFSIIDDAGNNLFADGGDGSASMRHAVGGMIAAMPESMLLFAPHLNSYRRLAIESHAPTAICWGYENRTAAIRIPGGPDSQRRIEHRVAGADTNPYLVMLGILGAALVGIEDSMEPSEPISGSAYDLDLPHLPGSWEHAMLAFEDGTLVERFCPSLLKEMILNTKRQELARFAAVVTPFEYQSYLDQV